MTLSPSFDNAFHKLQSMNYNVPYWDINDYMQLKLLGVNELLSNLPSSTTRNII